MIIETSQLALFIPAALALNLTPGSDNIFCLAKGLSGGPKAGVVASLGIATGSLIHSVLAAFGLAALLIAHPLAFEVVRWVGVGYLVYLAIKTFRTPVNSMDNSAASSDSLMRIWCDGILVNLFNPKVAIFILAFIPQFIDPDRGSTVVQFLIFGGILNVMGTTVAATIGGFSGGIGRHLAHNTVLDKAMRLVSGAVFMALAAKLALERN